MMNLPQNTLINQNAGSNTRTSTAVISLLIIVGIMGSCFTASAQQQEMMVRIAEIEIVPASLEEYKAILEEEAAASVKLEPGVIAIFPMYQKENPTQVRILEIYASKKAYEQHLKTPHFQKYKTTTLNMVKLLKLLEMEAVDVTTMPLIFKKLKENK
ncbi:putative quinol monooxygenase [Rhodocytophaga rosea]|nr:antibiotic biosynthesis monooxygenase [Rhodocytophaga rosea]